MTFADVFNEIINFRFNGGNVASAKLWVNARYGMVWNDRLWTFRLGETTVGVTANSAVVTLPADFGRAVSLFRSDGTPLVYIGPSDYDRTFYSTTPGSGTPDYYTVVNGAIKVGPAANVTDAAYDLIYQKKWVKLVNDADVPAIPEEYHYMLVHGGLATGLATVNDFTWEFQAQLYQEMLMSMRDNYVSDYGSTVQYVRDNSGLGSRY